jgi:hypothetical protein
MDRPRSDICPDLRDDLRVNGLKVPVVIDDADTIIDGRLRARLCDTLGIDWRQTAKVESGLTDDQKAALRIRLNLLRRSTPPTAAQRREYVRTLLKAEPELSNGTIAHLCGMDPSSISRIRSGMEVKGEVKAAEVTTGRDGRVRPKAQRSERPTTVAKSARQQSTQAQPQPSQREDNAPVVRPQVTDLPAVQPKVADVTKQRPRRIGWSRGELESHWEQAMLRRDRLRQERIAFEHEQEQSISQQDRNTIRELSHDLPGVWNAATTSMEDRKTLLRILVKRVHLDGVSEAGKIHIDIEWHTGAHSSMKVDRLPVGVWAPKTPAEAVRRIHELLPDHDYEKIAQILNDEGFRSAKGLAFNGLIVGYIARSRGWNRKPEKLKRLERARS